MSRRSGVLAMIVALATLTGCVSYRSLSSAEVTPRTELRVRFAAPRALVFKSGDSAVLPLDEVTELHGLMISGAADSIKVAAKKAMTALGSVQRFGSGTTVTFALADTHIDEVRAHTGATIALVTALVFGVLLLIVVASYEEPPPPPPPEPKPK